MYNFAEKCISSANATELFSSLANLPLRDMRRHNASFFLHSKGWSEFRVADNYFHLNTFLFKVLLALIAPIQYHPCLTVAPSVLSTRKSLANKKLIFVCLVHLATLGGKRIGRNWWVALQGRGRMRKFCQTAAEPKLRCFFRQELVSSAAAGYDTQNGDWHTWPRLNVCRMCARNHVRSMPFCFYDTNFESRDQA